MAAGVWVRRFSLHSFPIISMISHPVLYIGVSSFLFQPFSSLNGFGKSNWIFGETMRKNWYKLFSQRHCLILWLFVVHLRLFGLSACCCVAFQGEPAFARNNSKQVWFCPRLLAALHKGSDLFSFAFCFVRTIFQFGVYFAIFNVSLGISTGCIMRKCREYLVVWFLCCIFAG